MTNKTFRNHFCKLISDNYMAILFFIVLMISIIEEIFLQKEWGYEVLISCLICLGIVVILVISINSWRKTFIHIDDTVLVYEVLTLNKKKITISLEYISNVNITRNVFEAITGTRTIKLDINSSAISETDISMCLKKSEAELLEKLITRDNTDCETDSKLNDANISLDDKDISLEDINVYGYKESEKDGASIGNVFTHCLYSMQFISMIAIAILAGISLVFTSEDEVLTLANMGLGVGVVAVIIVAIGILVSLVKQFFAYYDFKSYRENDTINISYGLFNKHTFRIPINKINAISISTSVIGRICGKMHAQVKCVGVGDDEKEMSIITLSLSKEELHKKLGKLVPEFVPEEMKDSLLIDKDELNREPKSVKWLYSLYWLGYLAITVIAGVISTYFVDGKYYVVVAAIVFVLNIYFIVYIMGKYHTCGYLFLDNHVIMCEGAFSKKITIVSHRAIEGLEISNGPVMKKFGLFAGNIKIKASILESTISMCYISKEHKETLIDKYLCKCRRSTL